MTTRSCPWSCRSSRRPPRGREFIACGGAGGRASQLVVMETPLHQREDNFASPGSLSPLLLIGLVLFNLSGRGSVLQAPGPQAQEEADTASKPWHQRPCIQNSGCSCLS